MNQFAFMLTKLAQPLGFILMLLGLMLSSNIQLSVFTAGAVLTWIGIGIELKQYLHNRKSQNYMGPVTFYTGLIIKTALSIALLLRMLETEYSFFILLGCIVVSILWSLIAFFYSPSAAKHEDLLDR